MLKFDATITVFLMPIKKHLALLVVCTTAVDRVCALKAIADAWSNSQARIAGLFGLSRFLVLR